MTVKRRYHARAYLITEFDPHVVLSDRVPTPSLCLCVIISTEQTSNDMVPHWVTSKPRDVIFYDQVI